MTQLNKDYK